MRANIVTGNAQVAVQGANYGVITMDGETVTARSAAPSHTVIRQSDGEEHLIKVVTRKGRFVIHVDSDGNVVMKRHRKN